MAIFQVKAEYPDLQWCSGGKIIVEIPGFTGDSQSKTRMEVKVC